MNEQDLADVVRTIFYRVSERPLDDIGPETRIADLGIDSVTFAEIVVQIEDELDIEFPFARWLRVRTVQEVLEMIDQAARHNAERGA